MSRKAVTLFFVLFCFFSVFTVNDALSATQGIAINTVKHRSLSPDKDITIGSSLEGNAFLKNPLWLQYVDARQIQVVDFTADVDVSRIPGFDEQTRELLSEILVKLTVQFEVHKDTSIQIRFVGFSAPYGIIYASDSPQNGREIMSILYKNEIPDFRPILRNMPSTPMKSLPAKKEQAKEKPEIINYLMKNEKVAMYASVVRYSDKEFNIEIMGGGKNNYPGACGYKNVCTQDGENFICKGKSALSEISGKITSADFEIGMVNDNKHCTGSAFFAGKYEETSSKKAIEYTAHKKRVKPLMYVEEGFLIGYLMEDEKGEQLVFSDKNHAKVLDKFINTWIDAEYLSYTTYYEPSGRDRTFHILYKLNGKNPMEIE